MIAPARRNRLIPVVWSRAWRGHLWHARRTLAGEPRQHLGVGPPWPEAWELDDPTAACGFRPGQGQRPGRVSTWSVWRCQWVETTEREPMPTRLAGGAFYDYRCSACVEALLEPSHGHGGYPVASYP